MMTEPAGSTLVDGLAKRLREELKGATFGRPLRFLAALAGTWLAVSLGPTFLFWLWDSATNSSWNFWSLFQLARSVLTIPAAYGLPMVLVLMSSALTCWALEYLELRRGWHYAAAGAPVGFLVMAILSFPFHWAAPAGIVPGALGALTFWLVLRPDRCSE